VKKPRAFGARMLTTDRPETAVFTIENSNGNNIVLIGNSWHVTHYQTDFLTIEWDESTEAVVMNWTDFVEGDEYREGLNEGLELVKRHNSENWLADLRDMSAVSQEDQEWTRDEWHPRAFELPLTKMAIVQPESVVAEMSVEDLVQEIGEQITMQIFDDTSEAKAWLNE
jgi:hypothetical protein